MFCEKCGAKILDGSNFCKECGAKINQNNKVNTAVETKKDNMDLQNTNMSPKQQKNGKGRLIVAIVAGVVFIAVLLVVAMLWQQRKASQLTDDEIQEVREAYQEYVEENNVEDSYVEQNDAVEKEEIEDEDIDIDLEYHISQAYADVLTSFYYNDWDRIGIYGDDQPQGSIDMEYNTFAIVDIDADGVEELIISNNGTEYMYELASYIYSYDASLGKAVRWESITTPEPSVLYNGYVVAESLHDDSLGAAIIPCTIMSCVDKHLEETGYNLSSWDVTFSEEDYYGNYFPYSVDVDGDGIVYVVENYFSGETVYYDFAEYSSWISDQFGAEQNVSWNTLDLSAVYDLSNTYAVNYQNEISKLNTLFTTDLAYLYITGEDIMNATKDNLAFIKQDSNSLVYLGSKDGKQSIEYNSEDAGSIRYYGEPIKGVKLLGICPGDTIDKAVEKLNKYGFYDATNWGLEGYINGYTYNSYRIDIEIRDGKVYGISITQYNQYAG